MSCQNLDLIADKKDLYSTIIDKIAIPFPPLPAPLEEEHFKPIALSVIDSLQKIKLNLAITTYTRASKEDISKESIDFSYHIIISQHLDNDKDFKITKGIIHSSKGHRMTVLNEEEINDKRLLFENYDQLIYLSNIEFNLNRDKAVVYAGRTISGKLSGTSFLYLMKKEKGKWVIEMVNELSVS